MLLVSAIELTSETSCRSWRTPPASFHHALSVTRLNCATRGSCALSAGAGVANDAAPYQVLIVCCAVRLPMPDSMRAQSIQSVGSGELSGSQSLAGTPSALTTAACVPSGARPAVVGAAQFVHARRQHRRHACARFRIRRGARQAALQGREREQADGEHDDGDQHFEEAEPAAAAMDDHCPPLLSTTRGRSTRPAGSRTPGPPVRRCPSITLPS